MAMPEARGTVLFTVHRPGKPLVRYLVVTTPFGETGFYQQAVSLSSFARRELKRAFSKPGVAETMVYTSVDFDPRMYSLTLDFARKHEPDFVEPEIVHGGVYEAYRVIGYNRISQTYKEQP